MSDNPRADAYVNEWANKTGRAPSDIYVPQALRESAEQFVADEKEQPEEDTQPQFETGFAILKDADGNWQMVPDVRNLLSVRRLPSDDEVRQGSTEVAEYLRTARVAAQILTAINSQRSSS